MAKIIKLLTILFTLSLLLCANPLYLNKVHSYDKEMEKANDTQMLRIFHSLQNIYIKSIINNDKVLKKETLKRLIKSSKILKLNYKNYENELLTLQPSHNENTPTSIKVKKKKKPSPKKAHVMPRLIHISQNQGSLSLKFSRNVTYDDIKTFALNSKLEYKRVFDLRAVLSTSTKLKKQKQLREIRIASFNKSTIRLVLVSKKLIKYKIRIDNSTLNINFHDGSVVKKTDKTTRKVANFETFNPREKIIVLDPGHGGKDSGAIGYKGRYEKTAVLRIALKCYKELKKRGYRVYMTRSRDVFVKLRNRTKFANKKHADLFISIHANAAPKKSKYLTSKGLETFFLSPARSNRSKRVAALENSIDLEDMDYYSKNTFLNLINREKIVHANKLALDVQQGILRSIRQKKSLIDGGVRKAPFWVLVGAQMPAILIEAGYITNPTEGTRLFNYEYAELMAKGIADGVDSYFLKN